MGRVLIIGAGGVGQVVTHKCSQLPEVFEYIALASRTKSKCDRIASQISVLIDTFSVDADDVQALVSLIGECRPDLIINVALPYQDLTIMEACLQTGVNYLDTANYEPRDTAHFEYSWQWDLHERFREAGLTAILGSGFDPGVTNVFTAYLAKHEFDEIQTLDIIDVNGGDHGKHFATNFNPEINIREVTAACRHWEDGAFIETEALSTSRGFTCPEEVGDYRIYRMYHEELESLVKHYPTLRRAQFWMSFSEQYLTHLTVLQHVGMTRIDPIIYEGHEIIPLQFLKAVLPEPSTLGEGTSGRTCIGCRIRGMKDGEEIERYIYNICDHQEAFREVGSQAVSYTTGVPAMIGAKMFLEGKWTGAGVFNMEQFDPDPFMEDLNRYGLPWKIID